MLVSGFFLYKNISFSIWKVFFLISLVSGLVFLLSLLFNLNKDIPKIISWIILPFLTFLYIAIYSYLSILQYNAFHTGHWDLAGFDQAIWNTIQGKLLHTTLYGHNFLGEHMSPILILLAPFYLIWSDPRILLVLQSVFLGLGAIPIYLIAKDKLNHNLLSLSFSSAWLLHPYLSRINLFEFHEIALAPFFLLFCFYFLQRRQWWSYGVFLFLSLMVKESVTFPVMAIGIYSFFKINRKVGIITFLIGIFWAYLSVVKLIPYIRTVTSDGTHKAVYGYFAERFRFGETPKEFIKNIIIKPEETLRIFFFLFEQKLATIFLLILPVGLLSVFSVEILIAFPEIILHFLSTFSFQCLLGWQYSAPIIPFAIISSIFGCSFFVKRWKISPVSFSIYILIASFFSNYYFGIKVLTRITDSCYNPAFYNPNNHQTIFSISKEKLEKYYKIERRKRRLFETLKQVIPKERTISVVDNMLAHFSQRKTFLYLFPSYEEADYVVMNTYGVEEGWVQVWGSGEKIKKEIDKLSKDQRFQAFFTDEPGGGKIILFGKKECKDEIIKNAQRLVKDNPCSPEAHFILSSIYFYTNNLKMAKKEMEAVLNFDPNNTSAKKMLEEYKKLLDKNTLD